MTVGMEVIACLLCPRVPGRVGTVTASDEGRGAQGKSAEHSSLPSVVGVSSSTACRRGVSRSGPVVGEDALTACHQVGFVVKHQMSFRLFRWLSLSYWGFGSRMGKFPGGERVYTIWVEGALVARTVAGRLSDWGCVVLPKARRRGGVRTRVLLLSTPFAGGFLLFHHDGATSGFVQCGGGPPACYRIEGKRQGCVQRRGQWTKSTYAKAVEAVRARGVCPGDDMATAATADPMKAFATALRAIMGQPEPTASGNTGQNAGEAKNSEDGPEQGMSTYERWAKAKEQEELAKRDSAVERSFPGGYDRRSAKDARFGRCKFWFPAKSMRDDPQTGEPVLGASSEVYGQVAHDWGGIVSNGYTDSELLTAAGDFSDKVACRIFAIAMPPFVATAIERVRGRLWWFGLHVV